MLTLIFMPCLFFETHYAPPDSLSLFCFCFKKIGDYQCGIYYIYHIIILFPLQEKNKLVLNLCHRLGGGLTKLMEATEQIKVLNQQLEVQKVAVTEKSEGCEVLLGDISVKTELGKEKQQMAQTKSVEMEEQNKVRVCVCGAGGGGGG